MKNPFVYSEEQELFKPNLFKLLVDKLSKKREGIEIEMSDSEYNMTSGCFWIVGDDGTRRPPDNTKEYKAVYKEAEKHGYYRVMKNMMDKMVEEL